MQNSGNATIGIGIGMSSPEVIDEINILEATKKAMKENPPINEKMIEAMM